MKVLPVFGGEMILLWIMLLVSSKCSPALLLLCPSTASTASTASTVRHSQTEKIRKTIKIGGWWHTQQGKFFFFLLYFIPFCLLHWALTAPPLAFSSYLSSLTFPPLLQTGFLLVALLLTNPTLREGAREAVFISLTKCVCVCLSESLQCRHVAGECTVLKICFFLKIMMTFVWILM